MEAHHPHRKQSVLITARIKKPALLGQKMRLLERPVGAYE
jgi:hypothetical protein